MLGFFFFNLNCVQVSASLSFPLVLMRNYQDFFLKLFGSMSFEENGIQENPVF